MNEYQLGQILSVNLEYLVVSPCSVDLFRSIRERVHRTKTINRLEFGDFGLVGALSEYYVNIYRIASGNTAILADFPKKNTNLGFCSNIIDFPYKWEEFLYEFYALENLMLFSPAGTLSTIVAALV